MGAEVAGCGCELSGVCFLGAGVAASVVGELGVLVHGDFVG